MLIAKGAEAEIRQNDGEVIKERIKKGYRLPELDAKLRKRRTIAEAKLLREARRAGVNTPQILEESETSIKMEFIEGAKVKDILNEENCKKICNEVGKAVALLHGYDIIHGDLTTSNMIITKAEGSGGSEAWESNLEATESPTKLISDGSFSLYFIDFGLGFISKREEDKAIDLYLLHEALESTHFDILEKAWAAILDAYKGHYPADKVIKTLLAVEKRGRYKVRTNSMFS